MTDREQAAQWAAEVLADPRTAVLDTETTGLRGYVVELSVLAPDGRFLIDTLIDPQAVIEAGARNIHGIGREAVAGKKTFAELWHPVIKHILGCSRIIVYNADFDSGVMARELHRMGLDVAITNGWECAMKMYAQWVGEWDDYHGHYRWHKLNGGHRAGEDCAAVYDRLKEMASDGV
jgi:DNA polymerase III epsilon subunit-like protein